MNGLWIGCLCALQATSVSGLGGVPDELAHVEVRAVEVDAEGALWVATSDQGLARVDSDGLTWIASDALPLGVADLAEIHGDLWAVGLGGGSRAAAGAWTAVEVPSQPRVVFSATPGRAPGQVWFGSIRGAARWDAGVWTEVTEADGLPHAVVHEVLVEENGDVWFLCRRGVARLRDGSFDTYEPDVNFRTGIVGPDGTPWFGTSQGLLRWTGTSFERSLPGVVPYPRLIASDGSVWAGSAADGVLRFDGQEWRRPLPELDGHEVFDVAEGADGSIWIATAVGLRRLEVRE